MTTLEEWLPREGAWEPHLAKHLTSKVVQDFSGCRKKWPGKHKNVFNWCVIEGGRAIGWNENPSVGWSFPIIRYND